MNGNAPFVEVVIPPRSVVALPLVPTTQRREELLAKCAVDSHVTPEASRAPHELVWVTFTPLASIIWAARSRATPSRLVAKQTATKPFGSSTASVNKRAAICTAPGAGIVGTEGVIGAGMVGIDGVVGVGIVGTGMVGTAKPGVGHGRDLSCSSDSGESKQGNDYSKEIVNFHKTSYIHSKDRPTGTRDRIAYLPKRVDRDANDIAQLSLLEVNPPTGGFF